MAKEMRCGDVVPGCDYVATGNTEEEVLTQAAEHAREEHGMDAIPEDVLQKVKSAIHDK